MTHDLVERLRDPNYSGSMQHLRSYDEIDRLFNQAADLIESLRANLAEQKAAHGDCIKRNIALTAENATLRAERDAAFAMSKCECGADEACANLARLRAEKDEMRKALERIAAMWGTAGSEKGLPCRITDLNGTRESHTSTGVFASDVARQALAAIRNMGERT